MSTAAVPGDRPVLLTVSAALTALEGAALLVYAVLELANVNADRASVAVTSAVFFAITGGGLVLCAAGLARARSWARSPVVVAQLITVLTAWSFVGGETTWVAAVLATVSVAVLVCLLNPRSTAALAADET
ncbi:hypothetical protein [Nocardioides sp.]|uniref:hypothetical protein n=1 Tax=Nocardioides sp. TaxID=35761 RepID=UPI001A2071CA|nr:hypothetical protein [Nocardioides sp.]MBJ7358406.1 hypothetical protein [Nocardioides sp.]